MNSEIDDRLYYNIIIPYKPSKNGISPAVYQEQLNIALIQDPSKYYISIIRFTIPTANIPIMYPTIQEYPNTNVNNTIYSVTITYGPPAGPPISISREYIQFVTSTQFPLPSSPTIQNPKVKISPYYYVYSYINWISMINTTLTTAFNGLPIIAGSKEPYFIYDVDNKIISLVAQTSYYSLNQNPAPANIFKVYCNYPLLTFLDGMNVNFLGVGLADGLDIQFLIQNNHNNYYNPLEDYVAPPTIPKYLSVPQEYGTLTDWNIFQSLSIISNLLPTRQEFIPSSSANNNQSGVVNSVGVLTDFEPILQNGPEARTTVQYQVNSPYRLINLTSNIPLTKIDVNIYWVDKNGNSYLLDIPINSVLTMKIVFVKKSSYTSD
jgi:hypothetical protein